ncbi:MAG: GGDEF domain-containing protein [Gemmatimonadota bacterium]
MTAREAIHGQLPGLDRRVPPRALAISVLALLVAGLASLVWPESLELYSSLVWLLALIPCFLLAYHKGWGGAAIGLAGGMALLIGLDAVTVATTGRGVDWRVSGAIAVVLIAVSSGVGIVSELLRREKERALELAYVDPLTGLPNRRVLDYFLGKNFAAARRGQYLSLVLFDADGFKEYNDRHGHRAGDDVLRLIADILARNTRANNVSSRYGGDEFLTLLASEDGGGALVFAERIRAAVAKANLPLGDRLTLSAGIATYDPAMNSMGDLLDAADKALYRAKIGLGNRIEVATKADYGPWSGPTD